MFQLLVSLLMQKGGHCDLWQPGLTCASLAVQAEPLQKHRLLCLFIVELLRRRLVNLQNLSTHADQLQDNHSRVLLTTIMKFSSVGGNQCCLMYLGPPLTVTTAAATRLVRG